MYFSPLWYRYCTKKSGNPACYLENMQQLVGVEVGEGDGVAHEELFGAQELRQRVQLLFQLALVADPCVLLCSKRVEGHASFNQPWPPGVT
jgi:hypothetical protein